MSGVDVGVRSETRRAAPPGVPTAGRAGHGRFFAAGMLAGMACLLGAREILYVNWRGIVPPVDVRPLVIRADAKGDGRFGAPRSGSRTHQGVDIVAQVGTPVRAIRSGRVAVSTFQRGMGRYVVLQHAGGLRSLYGHLDTAHVAVGERVRQGQAIGTVGKTGNARSQLITAHLHVEVSRKGETFDPARLGLVLIEPAPRARSGRMGAPDE